MAENKTVPWFHLFEDSLAVPENIKSIASKDYHYFETEKHVAFSPLEQGISFENLLLLIVVAKLGKTPEGQKHLRDIAIKYLDSCASLVKAVQDSCAGANSISVISNLNLSAAIAHRLGLIDDGAYIRICEHNTEISNYLKVASVASAIAGPVSTLVQSGGEVAKAALPALLAAA